jgi:hypothetical protein
MDNRKRRDIFIFSGTHDHGAAKTVWALAFSFPRTDFEVK